MCGLAGIWSGPGTSSSELQSLVTKMGVAISHRGPDASGTWIDSASGFAVSHQRLAVMDLSSAGGQPMHSSSGRYVLTFNGEIYNHYSLRSELQKFHHLSRPWRGHSDTETLLAAIEAFGLENTLQRCAGMFALALWDRQESCLYLARDRFGEKPLYWGRLKHLNQYSFAFASDLASFRALPCFQNPAIDPRSLQLFFTYGAIPAPFSIYSDVAHLPPGHVLKLSSHLDYENKPISVPWWDLVDQSHDDFRKQSHSLSVNSSADLLESTLITVLKEQSLADVPLGVFLSGGIDSSLITALLQSQSPTPVTSLSVAFPDAPAFNEAPYASAIADYLGTNHIEVPLTVTDALALIPQLTSTYSEPFADSSQLPTSLVCREARRSGLTVALTGDGGDELFGGYSRHKLIPRFHRRISSLPLPLRQLFSFLLDQLPIPQAGLALDKKQKIISAIRSEDSLSAIYHSIVSIWSHPERSLLTPDWTVSLAQRHSIFPDAPSQSEQIMLVDALHYLPSDILAKVDRAAMSVSLETRAPFLDHRVASLAWQMPLSAKISPSGVSKSVLRHLLGRYLPPYLFERPKSGFAIPIGDWLRGPLQPWAEDLLNPDRIRAEGFLNGEVVQRIWRQHLSGHYDHTSKLWTILIWQSWTQTWDYP